MIYPLANVETTLTPEVAVAHPQLYTNKRSGAQSWTKRIASFVLFAAILVIAMASEAEAQVFTKKQRLLVGGSPSNIPLTYDDGPTYTGIMPVGSTAHIVYGIQVTSINTSTASVSLTITLPAAFSPTSLRCVRFPGGATSGNTVPPASIPSLPMFTITVQALAVANDKQIVVIDGFFSQAGNNAVSFAATRVGTTESTSLAMTSDIVQLPADISITKKVAAQGSNTFSTTATIPIYPTSGTVTYKLIIKNESPTDPNHSTDVYLGPLLKLKHEVSTPMTNDVVLTIKKQNFQCASSPGADCPSMPSGSYILSSMNPGISQLLHEFAGYPPGSNGFLPAQGWFEITYDVVIGTPNPCSPLQNNRLESGAYFTYSNSTNTFSDTNASNNTASPTVVFLTNIPMTCPPPIPFLLKKELISPVSPATPNWGNTLRYKITLTNPSTNTQTLPATKLTDQVFGIGTPPFKATFAASSVVCNPACISPQPSSSTIIVSPPNGSLLFEACFAALPPGASQTLEYDVKYEQVCATSSAGLWEIRNFAGLSDLTTGAWLAGAFVNINMPLLPLCQIEAKKTLHTVPTPFSSYPAMLGYTVEFKNNSLSPVTVYTLRDAIALDSQTYGNVPASYLYTCTATPAGSVTGASSLSQTTTQALIQYNNPPRAGVQLFYLSSPGGITFAPQSTLSCDVAITLNQPPTNDSKCQSVGAHNIVNTAIMDLGYYNIFQTPVYYAEVKTPLPKCISVNVGKTPSQNVYAGGPVTFTLTVHNAGNDTVQNIVLNDNVPAVFTNVTWSCVSGCTGSGTGNNISIPLNPLPGGATATVQVFATAPAMVGSHCNTTNATFNPFPPLTYFEGVQNQLMTATTCVQVTPAPESVRGYIQKILPNIDESFAGSFNFNVACTSPVGSTVTSSQTISFTSIDPLTTYKGLKVKRKTVPITGLFMPGTNCTVTEVGPLPVLPPKCSWKATSAPPSGSVTLTTGGLNLVTFFNNIVCSKGDDPNRRPGDSARPRPKKAFR